MNSRERLMAVFKNKQPDRIPWAPLIDEYYTSSLPKQGYNMNVVETLRFIGGDILERHIPIERSTVKNTTKRQVKSGNEIMNEIVTPVGTIKETHRISDGGKTTFLSKPYICCEEDAKIMQYVFEHLEYEGAYETFIERQNYIGDDGLATISSPLTPIQQLLQSLMHIEPFTYALYDYTETIEELMAAMHEANLRCYRVMAESPAEVVIDYEDTSTTVLSPSWFDQYCREYLDEYADIIHKNGKVFITHMCGKLKGVASLISKCRMDGIDSVCPPTTGDTWLNEALDFWPGKIIIGGIEPPALRRMSVEQTRDYVMDILNKVGSKNRIILSTGDATAHDTPIENLMEVSRIIKQYGAIK